MPAKSEAQRRFMQAVAHGNVKKKGLSPEEAMKFLHHDDDTEFKSKLRKPKKRG